MWLHLPFPSLCPMFCFPVRVGSADPRAAQAVFVPQSVVAGQSSWNKACTSVFCEVSASWEILCRPLTETRANPQIYLPFMYDFLSLEFATR